ncbi:hypothetical protein SteCoe_35320 [Stentor coeruleus]|uniref:Mei2-like C-terminal RNA recognition motif domain-containing protein n=1 Tax=Stentor coeruleus TaxID=5963 RepID=A0A1R2ASM4_9CILI|nr:hypothetical protein SteCoe_35320 [Stentor coeruleus]
MEESHKKRLSVFRTITRDFSPSLGLVDTSHGVPETLSVSKFSLSNISSQQHEGSEFNDGPSFLSERGGKRVPYIEPLSYIPNSKANMPVRALANLEPKSAIEVFHRKAVPSLDAKRNDWSKDTSLNTSGSLSNRSQYLNISTEESSKEENEERGKPKKRPLEEGERGFYIIKLDYIKNGQDKRTTIMIKNIPNKYTQKMLIQAIDRNFTGTYDFLYLPIDFKNRCNVGYAFINFVDYRVIPAFFHEFNAKRWEKFNSEKICALAYGRIQGLQELVQHFQNSSVINQDDNKVKPIILSKH